MQSKSLKTILVVDDDPINISVLSNILKDDYQVVVAKTGEQAIAIAQKQPDIILLDVMMPVTNGYDVCKVLKAENTTKHIPIIFVTAMCNEVDEMKGFELGAVDYITKPISAPIVLARVRNHIQLKQAQENLLNHNALLEEAIEQRTCELINTQNSSILALATLAETRDNETGSHIKRTQYYVKALAEDLVAHQLHLDELVPESIELLYKSAPLHDIGKVGIPDSILLKAGKLDQEEFSIMQTHAKLGADAIQSAEKQLGDSQSSFLRYAREIALYHHEKWDGSGYPFGLKEQQIPLSARLMAVADVYDALISKRVYKPAFTHQQAREIIIKGKGQHFDPIVVDAFLRIEQTFIDIVDTYRDEQE